VLLACGVIAFVGAIVGLRAEPRWASFVATAPVAWDTARNRKWLQGEHDESNMPLTAAAKPVEPSAYFRIAYLKEGVKLLAEHPWGTRVGRDAFRLGIRDKYGVGGMSHAHNGFLDVGVSLGFPGVVLWIAFMGSIVYFAWRTATLPGVGLRAALVLVVASFAARTCLDATLRDHVLQEFMLVAGALMAAIALGPRRDS
jgi:O-antigen ligase